MTSKARWWRSSCLVVMCSHVMYMSGDAWKKGGIDSTGKDLDQSILLDLSKKFQCRIQNAMRWTTEICVCLVFLWINWCTYIWHDMDFRAAMFMVASRRHSSVQTVLQWEPGLRARLPGLFQFEGFQNSTGLSWWSHREKALDVWDRFFRIYLYQWISNDVKTIGGCLLYHWTGAMMVLTLKVTSAAINYQDGLIKDEDSLRSAQKTYRLKELPSPIAFAGYCLNCGTHLAGPVYEIKDYMDWTEDKGVCLSVIELFY